MPTNSVVRLNFVWLILGKNKIFFIEAKWDKIRKYNSKGNPKIKQKLQGK